MLAEPFKPALNKPNPLGTASLKLENSEAEMLLQICWHLLTASPRYRHNEYQTCCWEFRRHLHRATEICTSTSSHTLTYCVCLENWWLESGIKKPQDRL